MTAVDLRQATVTMRQDRDGQTVTFDQAYAAGHLGHACAITVHEGKGTPRAHTRVYADPEGAALVEHGYVALSRGAQESLVHVTRDQMAAHIAPGVFVDRRVPLERLGQQPCPSAVELPVTDAGRPISSEPDQDLVARRDQPAATGGTVPPEVSDRLAQADQALAAAETAGGR